MFHLYMVKNICLAFMCEVNNQNVARSNPFISLLLVIDRGVLCSYDRHFIHIVSLQQVVFATGLSRGFNLR